VQDGKRKTRMKFHEEEDDFEDWREYLRKQEIEDENSQKIEEELEVEAKEAKEVEEKIRLQEENDSIKIDDNQGGIDVERKET